MSEVRLLPYGDAAILIEVADVDAVLAWGDALRAADPPEVDEVVPGARTLLVVASTGTPVTTLRAVLESLRVGPGSTGEGSGAGSARPVEIPVTYDGPDLAEVARLTGLGEDGVVAAHTGRPWRVAFGGFAPGFAYLTGGDARLEVPRRVDPRTRVPAGAVGLAGTFSGVYPRESPGGWQLIGRTDRVLWDLDRHPPALLSAGAPVRFVAVER